MKTEKVQSLVTTIRDARDFLTDLRYAQQEFPGMTDARDAQLQQRIISQLRAAIFDLHNIFFETSLKAKVNLIAVSRRHKLNKRHLTNAAAIDSPVASINISSATIKARERRQRPTSAIGIEAASSSSSSAQREKKTPKRVDCGLRDGYLPKKEPPRPVKLNPRKYYSKHGNDFNLCLSK